MFAAVSSIIQRVGGNNLLDLGQIIHMRKKETFLNGMPLISCVCVGLACGMVEIEQITLVQRI